MSNVVKYFSQVRNGGLLKRPHPGASTPFAVGMLQPVAALLSASIRMLTVVVAANDAGTVKHSAASVETANNRVLPTQVTVQRLLRRSVSAGAAAPENVD